MGAPPIAGFAAVEARGRDFLCGVCSYGIALRGELPESCPMCGAFSWVPARPRRHEPVLGEHDAPAARRPRLALLHGRNTSAQEPAPSRAA